MNPIVARPFATWRGAIIAVLMSLALTATLAGMAQPAAAAAPPAVASAAPEDVVAPLTPQQIATLAAEVQKTLTPAEKQEVAHLLAEYRKKVAADSGGEVTAAAVFIPWVVAQITYLIARYGIPWVIRYANNLWTSVFLSQALKTQACAILRSWGNGWGWSWYCWGTY